MEIAFDYASDFCRYVIISDSCFDVILGQGIHICEALGPLCFRMVNLTILKLRGRLSTRGFAQSV